MAVCIIGVNVPRVCGPIGQRHHNRLVRGRSFLQLQTDFAVDFAVHGYKIDISNLQQPDFEVYIRTVFVAGKDVLAGRIRGIQALPAGAGEALLAPPMVAVSTGWISSRIRRTAVEPII